MVLTICFPASDVLDRGSDSVDGGRHEGSRCHEGTRRQESSQDNEEETGS